MKHFWAITVGIIVLAAANLLVGSADIPASDVLAILLGKPAGQDSWRFIVMESRLPQMLTALLCGAALSTSGLMLQTAFRNPLAGPSIFGITNGAGLGVAVVMLATESTITAGAMTVSGFLAILLAAFAGAMAITAIILLCSTIVRNNVMLLIVGIMVGYLSSSAIALLNFSATEEGVRSYMVWGMGNFSGVPMEQIPYFSVSVVAGLAAALLLVKPLNALLLGEQYAENLGINTLRVRHILLLVTGLLTAVSTAFCGPIAFIGLAVPHITRLMTGTENHRRLLPLTMLMGSAVALACNLICIVPGEKGIIPINAVTPLVGAPVIIYVIFSLYAPPSASARFPRVKGLLRLLTLSRCRRQSK